MKIFYISLLNGDRKFFRFLMEGFSKESRQDLLDILKFYKFMGWNNSFSVSVRSPNKKHILTSHVVNNLMIEKDKISSEDVLDQFLMKNGDIKGTLGYVVEDLLNFDADINATIKTYNPSLDTSLIAAAYGMDHGRFYKDEDKLRETPFASVQIDDRNLGKQIFLKLFEKYPSKLDKGDFNDNFTTFSGSSRYLKNLLSNIKSTYELSERLKAKS